MCTVIVPADPQETVGEAEIEHKGIVSRDGVSTETIGVKFRPKQYAAY
jgi:hypothetical protein